jgi:hypothetical protein
LILLAVCSKQELWSSLTRWLACEQYLGLSVHKAVCNWDLWQLTTSLCKVVWSVVFIRWLLVALELQVWLVSFSPSKVDQFNLMNHPQSHKVISVICPCPHSGRLACLPNPVLSLLSFPGPKRWIPCPTQFSEIGAAFHPIPTVSGRLLFTVYVFQFCLGTRCNLLMSCTGLCYGGACVVCGAHLLAL